MDTITKIAFLLLAGFIAACSAQTCATNERYRTCNPSDTPYCDVYCDGRSITACQSGLCATGCYCRANYRRNYANNCVMQSACSTCEGTNEVFLTCKDQCPQTCQNLRLGIAKPTCSNMPCQQGCNCATGYVLDTTTNTCVLLSTCQPIVCGSNQSPSLCENTCEQTCNNNILGIAAPTPCTSPCQSGCDCNANYVRDSSNACVPIANCATLSCGSNQVRTLCDNTCEQTCNNNILGIPAPTPCTTGCAPGCDCASGYVRNTAGTCVAVATCPLQTCPAGSNQVPVLCDNTCEQTCNNLILGIAAPTPCQTGCSSGCDCASGYVRNSAGACVAASTCPLQTCPAGSNQVPVLCDNTCEQTCNNLILGIAAPTPCQTGCSSGCDCATGYVRDSSGTCVPSSTCPLQTCPAGSNQVPVLCDNTCEQTCNNLILGIAAPTPCQTGCSSGCDCASGYVRDSSGTCVAASTCPLQTCPAGSNQIPVLCDNTCEQTCNNLILGISAPTPCVTGCTSGCDCASGYVRDTSGTCVAASTCPLQTCPSGSNQVPVLCDNTCEQTCDNLILGMPAPTPCVTGCTSGCDCATGYVRNSAGACVASSTCPLQTCPAGSNQIPVLCDNTCEQTCNNLILGIAAPTPCQTGCSSGCDCASGYVRDSSGACVAASSCPLQTCPAGSNQIPVLCDNTCEQTCDNLILGISAPTPCVTGCSSGCDCASGYVRNSAGACVAASTCQLQTCPAGSNQVPVLCDNTCEQTCNNLILGVSAPTPCVTGCTSGCDCAPGYVRNTAGACVAASTCPLQTCPAGSNQVPVVCHNTCEQTCDNLILGTPAPTPCLTGCSPGCDCSSGYVRDQSGACVASSTCPLQTCPSGSNQVPVLCDNTCEQTCDNNIINIPAPTPCVTSPCTPGCDCAPGYFRDNAGNCVPMNMCVVTCGPNSSPTLCDNTCEQTCDNVILGFGTPTPCIESCGPGCDCDSNYVRDENDNCVSVSLCTPVTCPTNEVAVLCDNTCEYTCAGNIFGDPIPPPCYASPCVPGCDCVSGFVRNNAGVCVDITLCPTTTCGANEDIVVCDNTCEQTCNANILGVPPQSPACTIPCTPGCDCQNGYYRDTNGLCTSNCAPVMCGANEVPTLCHNTCEQTCTNLQLGIPASPPCITGCSPGCDCATGYVRDVNGNCVNGATCVLNCGANEIGVMCHNTCEQTCDNNILGVATPTPCISPCVVGCDCQPGYVRDGSGACVNINNCAPVTCGTNEIATLCDNTCELTCTQIRLPQDATRACATTCVPGCDCGPGFVRDGNGACIDINSCNGILCGLNQVAVACDNTCEQTCLNNILNIAPPTPCQTGCIAGCDCAAGYLRDASGGCVEAATECVPLVCGQDEVEVACDNICEQTCWNSILGLPTPTACVDPCQPGCDCRQGYVRSPSGVCVAAADCPQVTCNVNETPVLCDNTCEKTCDDLKRGDDAPTACTQSPCVPGCDCASGYYRDSTNVCVAEDLCTPCNYPNEEYRRCLPRCHLTCLHKKPFCPNWLETSSCTSGCVCKDGFYKNLKGKCVTYADCKKFF